MQKKKLSLRRDLILRTVFIFLCSYLLFLVLWIQVKDYYGEGVVYITSRLVAIIKDVEFEELTRKGDFIQATFRPLRHKAGMLMDIPMNTSSYTFNAPLTFGIMAAFFPFITRRKRAYVEALGLLFGGHLLAVFSFETYNLTVAFVDRGFDPPSNARVSIYKFLWQFTENMVVKFEPFLIGFYMFIRFRR
ncbi:MAG TPA: hypothetical protein VN328_02025 [Thermodesulfovibrionales bacterium]|nr:hypothetical protein [Thermodesulfovibrionales bacterium]